MEGASLPQKYKVSISKELLSKLPLETYCGGATIIDSIERVDEAVSELCKARIIGFDSETRPSFRRGVSYPVSLLQLATPEKCFLFRLHKLGLPPQVKGLLEDASILKVGISLRDDFHQLFARGLQSPAGFVDLQKLVVDYGIIDASLARIYGILFGKRIAKAQRLSNWEAPHLTEAQVNYAAFDARACILIYEYLKSGAFVASASPYLVP